MTAVRNDEVDTLKQVIKNGGNVNCKEHDVSIKLIKNQSAYGLNICFSHLLPLTHWSVVFLPISTFIATLSIAHILMQKEFEIH